MAKSYGVQLRWARKILKAKHFIVLTDSEGIIALQGVDPHNLHDVIMLEEQAATISGFMERLKDLKREHDEAIANIMEVSDRESKKKVSRAKRSKTKAKEV